MTLFSQGNPVPPGPPGTLSRMVVLPPDMERVLRFYTAHAPAELPAPEAWPAIDSDTRSWSSSAGPLRPSGRRRPRPLQRAICRHRS